DHALGCARSGDFRFALFFSRKRAALLRYPKPPDLALGKKIAAIFFDDLLLLERATGCAGLVRGLGRRALRLLLLRRPCGGTSCGLSGTTARPHRAPSGSGRLRRHYLRT